MKRVLLQPGYVLHRRSYRENSFLVELFTQDFGRLSLVARGVRKLRSPLPGLLQPFTPLLISWVGKTELMTLSHVETNGAVKTLQGECLFAGLYINELLMYLLQKWDAHSNLYIKYATTLDLLQNKQLQQGILRSFEKCLLQELGYGLLPNSSFALSNTFAANKYYQFILEQGFVLSEYGNSSPISTTIFSGKSLLAIAHEDWREEQTLQDAKRLIRLVLSSLLGTRPVYSRKLFQKLASIEAC